ncbi:proton-coupled folate transporter-like [Patiria miniata]|uniref:Proton-coupled folate transporter n=1 Tax=Patiria miniata TaxID=46514 RepID=A0A914ARW0_PATMI|nr:proton-coupled folate transporter-like [Patiria miniata]
MGIDMDSVDTATGSEDKPLLEAEKGKQRFPWVSLAIFLVLQILIAVPEGMLQTLSVQFARSAFASERNVTLPVGVNACATSPHDSSELADVQAAVALFATYQSCLKDFIPVLTALPLIALADFTGRRPVLLSICLGGLVEATGFLIVSFFEISVYYTLVGSAVFGVCGGFILLNSISMLYVIDIVPKEHRGVALAMIYAFESAVIYLGPLVINVLLEALSSYTICFLIPACSALLACLWLLPPNLVQESVKKQPLDLGVASGIGRGICRLFTDTFSVRLVVLLACDSVVNLLVEGFDNTVSLYGLGEPFCWSPTLLGVFSVVHGVPHSLAAPLIVWVIELFLSDYWLIYISILSSIAQFLLTAVATSNEVLIYGASLVGIFAGVSQPVFVSLITRLVDTKFHGALFSMYSLVFGASTAFSFILQSAAYSFTVSAGLTVVLFYAMASLSALVLVPTICMHILEPKDGFDDKSP